MSDKKAILVIGAGDATGGAVARRFAREGYIACVTRRDAKKLKPLTDRIASDGGEAHGFASDARKEDEMVALVERVEREIAPIEVAVFNIGANVRFGIAETTSRVYEAMFVAMWEQGADMSQEAEIHRVLGAAGLDGASVLAKTQEVDVKNALSAATQAAYDRGTFGSPTFFVDDEIYFGKDRLREVEERIVAGAAR